MHGQTGRSMLLQLLPGVESENQRWSIIGSDEWLLNNIALHNSFLAGLSTGKVRAEVLHPRMNLSTRLWHGLVIQTHGLERHGRRERDSQSSSLIAEPCLFWTDWSRSKIRPAHKRDGCVSLRFRRCCANSRRSMRGYA